MPLFLSDEEFLRCSHDSTLVAEKADAFIRDLYVQLETVRAESDAAAINAEQTCSLIEQKYVSLSTEFSSLQSQLSELNSSIQQRAAEVGQLQSEKQQFQLQQIDKHGEIDRLSREVAELHKSKRQLMEMLEQKDLEISEKNSISKSYLDKIVNLTEIVASKEARLGDVESELARVNATSARYLQEKELLERHNTWLNEELTAKVDSLIQLRKVNGEFEADMTSKLAYVEKKYKESSSSSRLYEDRVRELEAKLASMEEELLSTKDAGASAEERFSAEIATVNKLVELYKENSGEWSKKAGELEGVIKALETHLNQVENEYKDKLEKEVSMRIEVEKECSTLKEKLQACEAELENFKKDQEMRHLPLSSFFTSSMTNLVDASEMVKDDRAIVPSIPAGVSGTALAASLLRDGWSLAKMYVKYQEAVDALRHEQLGRKQTEAILERVFYEIEEKAGVIMDEREEHERLVEAYSGLNQKLQHSLSEHTAYETTIQGLKASLKRQERDYAAAQKEITDLEKQVAALLKECRDVQLRCGSAYRGIDDQTGPMTLNHAESDVENLISDRLLTFKDINGLVEQNVQLRTVVRSLSHQIEEKEAELKEKYEKELQRHNDETASRINAVLQRAEEQGKMIESLHNSVAMYKKLYEEEHNLRSRSHPQEAVPERGGKEIVVFRENSHETSTKASEQASERVKNLEEDLAKSRSEMISLRSERDKLALEAQFAQDKLARYMKDFEHQRQEHNGVISRNVEFSQQIVDYQRKLREFSESVNASNELSRKLTMEVSVLKHEKEILQNSEKRASDEVRSLSERLHRLQASLNTIQSTEEAREEARGNERRKLEEYTKKIEREWAEARRELQEERDNVRNLMLERESTMKNALRQVEDLSKELSNALQSVAAAESRAAVAEARYSDLEKIMESTRVKDSGGAEGDPSSSSEKILANFQAEIEKLREEAQASKDHMLQYKSIAQVNETALKQMESTHENFRTEADRVRSSLEAEVHSLRERVNELENECTLKSEEVKSAATGKEEALNGVLHELASLREDCSAKMSQISVMESQICALKRDLEEEHQRWRAAQSNYERQVILQSETIQELMKTSQALASSQEETSKLRRVVDVLKLENNELKSKSETEKLVIEVYKNEVDKKYSEVNELNKILDSRLEAMYIKLAEKERGEASGSSSQAFAEDAKLQNIVTYLRRTKEIVESEISILKQENLRLQSQLDSALKSAEAAQASLSSERMKSRASLFTEEDFKSLQLQVTELTLLRESNKQLRAENQHNFEECQKLREAFQKAKMEIENLENLLKDRETELETQREQIGNLKKEKLQFEKQIVELVDKCKSVDVDDYNRMKESLQQLQANLTEKDVQLEEVKRLLSEKQEAISVLERDFSRCRTELNEREIRINQLLQAEASLKSEVERFKRINVQSKRKQDSLLKEKDDLSKEMQALSKQKDDLSKEMQALSKQLEDAKQVKILDPASEQSLKISVLEKTIEKSRDELRKEREDHQKEKDKVQRMKRVLLESRGNVTKEKMQVTDEVNKVKQAVLLLQDEVEKLRNPVGCQSESTSVVQAIVTTSLDDSAANYYQAADSFDQVAQSVELETLVAPDASSSDTMPPVAAIVGQAVTSSAPAPTPPPANVPATRTSDDRERRLAIPRANIKTGRKLVRPSITKPKEPQGDIEMSEADEPNTGLSSHITETQGHTAVPTSSLARKRSAASSPPDLQESLPPEEATSDLPVRTLKKSRHSDSVQEGGDELSAPDKLREVLITEESLDNAGTHQEGDQEDLVDAEKDDSEIAGEQTDEPAADEQIQAGSDAGEVAAEKLDKPSEAVLSDDQLRDQTEQDIQRIVAESDEIEEGELEPDLIDNDDDGNIADVVMEPEAGEPKAEETAEPESSPGIEPVTEALEAGEIDLSESQEEEKNDGSDPTENIVDSSNKLHDGVDSTGETSQGQGVSDPSCVEASAVKPIDPVASDQSGPTPTPGAGAKARSPTPDAGAKPPSPTPDAGAKPPSPTPDAGAKPPSPVNTRTIILSERAKVRAQQRQAGIPSASPSRGRGRAIRGRGTRGTRGARGQSPG